MLQCEKCAKPISVEAITLLGGYNVYLCVNCRNECYKFITATEEYKKRNALEVDLRIAIQEKDRPFAFSLNTEILKNERKLFHLGENWCTGVSDKK